MVAQPSNDLTADQTAADAAASDAARRQLGGDLASTQPTAPAPAATPPPAAPPPPAATPPPSPVPPKPVPTTAQSVSTEQTTGFTDPGKAAGATVQGAADTSSSRDFNNKTPFWTGPYDSLKEIGGPALDAVNKAANAWGVSPARLALHWWLESEGKITAPDGAANEMGPLQITPQTYDHLDPKHQYDPRNYQDGLYLAAKYIHELDGQFGRDSPSSVAAYQSGAKTIDELAHSKGQQGLDYLHPNTRRYLDRAYPGQNIALDSMEPRNGISPEGLTAAGTKYGPDGAARYISYARSPGVGPSDAWRQAESAMVGYYLFRGDVAGAIHAHDWVFQMSHAGTNQYLMQAHQMLSQGDSWGAANALAKAGTFFPDDTMGRFYVDRDGTIWAQRMDEHNPDNAVGKPFKVDQNGIETMLRQTTDPNQFLDMLYKQRANAADIRYKNAQSFYEEQKPQLERELENAKGQWAVAASAARGENAAQLRAEQDKQASQQDAASWKNASQEATKAFGPDSTYPNVVGNDKANIPPMSAEARGAGSEIMADLIHGNAITPVQAKTLTDNIMTGKDHIIKQTDGRYAVKGPNDQVFAYLRTDLGDRITAERQAATKGQLPPAQASPVNAGQSSAIPNSPTGSAVGAGLASPMAAMGGVQGGLNYPTTPPIPLGTVPAGVIPSPIPTLVP